MKRILVLPLILALTTVFFQSCKKTDDTPQLIEGQLEISFTPTQLKNGYVQGLTSVVVSIEDVGGNVVKNMEKVEIYSMNGYYISKPISLLTGDYKLTGFFVLDADNNVVYASPLSGSDKAYLVENPLPIAFSVTKDNVTKLTPEVLSTAESTPEDFGYATFGFDIAQTFDFLVGAFVYNDAAQNFELTTAKISVYSGSTLLYSGELQANGGTSPDNYDPLGITNKITLPERYETFTVEISKAGYVTYNQVFTKEELRLYYRSEDNGPLVVILTGTPVLTTIDVNEGTVTSVYTGGNIINSGDKEIFARGVCWGTEPNPTISNNFTSDGTGAGAFTSSITGLVSGTIYYVRAYATNSVGTAYGNEINFIVDIEGNVYNTVTIGSQVWLVQNLKVTKFNDGTAIPNVVVDIDWETQTAPGYCWYNNDEATYKSKFGALYNWYTVDVISNGNKNIAPTGWHVPSDAEWIQLADYLGGVEIAGGKMKEAGTSIWVAPNTGATNESGFTALPASYRNVYGVYSANALYKSAFWWGTGSIDASHTWYYNTNNTSVPLYRISFDKHAGFSIRCLKD